jgi:hypothetical protein
VNYEIFIFTQIFAIVLVPEGRTRSGWLPRPLWNLTFGAQNGRLLKAGLVRTGLTPGAQGCF